MYRIQGIRTENSSGSSSTLIIRRYAVSGDLPQQCIHPLPQVQHTHLFYHTPEIVELAYLSYETINQQNTLYQTYDWTAIKIKQRNVLQIFVIERKRKVIVVYQKAEEKEYYSPYNLIIILYKLFEKCLVQLN